LLSSSHHISSPLLAGRVFSLVGLDAVGLLLAVISELLTVRILHGDNVTLIKWTLLLRSCLLFRLFSNFKSARKIIASLVRLGPALLCFLSALLGVYYFWAILGMELYWDLLVPDNPGLVGTLYAESDYFANNFNSFLRSFVLLFELMVVNNWFIVGAP
jgi:Ion transport protein